MRKFIPILIIALIGTFACGTLDEQDTSPVEIDLVKSECVEPDGNCDDGSGEDPNPPPCYPNCN